MRWLPDPPHTAESAPPGTHSGGALPPDEAIPGLGTTTQAASLGRGTRTWVKQDADAGKTMWRSEGGGKETEGKGKAAWCPSFPYPCCLPEGLSVPPGHISPRAAEAHPPRFLHLLTPGEGDRFPEWGRGPNLPTHTGDPLTASRPHAEPTLWKKPTFPMATKEGSLQTSTHCNSLPQQRVFLNKFLPD